MGPTRLTILYTSNDTKQPDIKRRGKEKVCVGLGLQLHTCGLSRQISQSSLFLSYLLAFICTYRQKTIQIYSLCGSLIKTSILSSVTFTIYLYRLVLYLLFICNIFLIEIESVNLYESHFYYRNSM